MSNQEGIRGMPKTYSGVHGRLIYLYGKAQECIWGEHMSDNLRQAMTNEYSRWQCRNIVVWTDGTIRPWLTNKTYYDQPPVIKFDGQVYFLPKD